MLQATRSGFGAFTRFNKTATWLGPAMGQWQHVGLGTATSFL